MSRSEKVLQRILQGGADANIDFEDLCALLRSLGFAERIRGSHHVFVRPGVEELLNLQQDGGNAKPFRFARSGTWSSSTIWVPGTDMAHKYELIVFWSAEDAAFVVDVPELPGCMAHGATPAEAVGNAQQAIDLWVETAEATQRTVPEPKGRRLIYA
jgi:predicted RNase H-like HicB family nuclease